MWKTRAMVALLFAGLLADVAVAAEGQVQSAAPGYVGGSVCAGCHAEAAAAWTNSHHDWALKPAKPPFVLGNFDNTSFEHKGFVTRFSRDGDVHFLETDGPDGKPTRYPVRYAVGVTPLQQYLVEIEPGRLQVLDIAWDTVKGKWFHLYPDQITDAGYGLHWTGPYKSWNARCADCHQTDFRKNYDPHTRQYKSSWSDANVSCEACHGPGAAHVAWAKNYPDNAEAAANALKSYPDLTEKGLTIGFSRAEPETEIQRCAQCHSRREQLSADSPVAGTPFADHYRLSRLRPDIYFPDGQVKEEVYVYGSFLQSRMYAKGVGCTNCHDPHSLTLKADGNAICTQCHSPAANPDFPSLRAALYDDPAHHRHVQGTAGGRCVSCHMPERTYMLVDPRRDHSFRVPRPELSDATGAPNACVSCHADKDNGWASASIREWYPQGRHTRPDPGILFSQADRQETANEDVTRALIAYANDIDNPGIVRASALDRLAVAVTPELLSRIAERLTDADPAVRSAAVALHRGMPPEARTEPLGPLLRDPRKSVRIDAARQLIDVPQQSIAPEYQAALSQAMGEFRATLTANSDAPETQMALGGLALTFRNAPAAVAAFRTARELDPGLVEAWRMQARVEWASGDTKAALRTIGQGVERHPGNADLLQVKAGLQAATGDPAGAIETYEAALLASPGDLQLRLGYADYLASGRAHDRVLEVLTPLRSEHPDNPELLFLIARSALLSGQDDLAQEVIKAFRRTNSGHPLEREIDGLLSRRQ